MLHSLFWSFFSAFATAQVTLSLFFFHIALHALKLSCSLISLLCVRTSLDKNDSFSAGDCSSQQLSSRLDSTRLEDELTALPHLMVSLHDFRLGFITHFITHFQYHPRGRRLFTNRYPFASGPHHIPPSATPSFRSIKARARALAMLWLLTNKEFNLSLP